MAHVSVGAVGGGPPHAVDPVGGIAPAGAGWTWEWWIGADDRWRVPAHEVAVRQSRVGGAPVVETAMRVPGGDALERVYGVAGAGDPLVIEIENRSPAPFAVAFVVRGARRVAVDGSQVHIDDAFVLSTSRPPSRWARTVGDPVLLPVTTGRAEVGPFASVRDRSGRLEVAFLHPVAHRTTLRAVLTRGRDGSARDPATLPDVATVVGGWARLLDHGMRVEVPDDSIAARIRAARSEVLLRAHARLPGPLVVAALEDWGFDAEAGAAWRRLGIRDRRRAATRPEPSSWRDAARLADDAAFLVAARRLLVDDRPGTRDVTLLAEWPAAWRGLPLEVRDAPVAGGTLSFAIRWHGARPALLWDAPGGVTITVPVLDPHWTSSVPRGEALLAPVEGAA